MLSRRSGLASTCELSWAATATRLRMKANEAFVEEQDTPRKVGVPNAHLSEMGGTLANVSVLKAGLV
jgi:hypothetical protein